jgi:hypothetical protein
VVVSLDEVEGWEEFTLERAVEGLSGGEVPAEEGGLWGVYDGDGQVA